MKRFLTLLVMAIMILPSFAQGGGGGQSSSGPSQIEIAATGIAEIYKKSIKLTKEQYPKVKKAYLKFLTNQAYNPTVPGVGREKLEKTMQKILTPEQFKLWREQDPNRPLTDEEKEEMKKRGKNAKFEPDPSKQGGPGGGGPGGPGGGHGGGPGGGPGGGGPGGPGGGGPGGGF